MEYVMMTDRCQYLSVNTWMGRDRRAEATDWSQQGSWARRAPDTSRPHEWQNRPPF